MPALTVEDVVCSVGCGRVRSENFVASARLAQRTVSDDDIAKVLAAGKTFVERDGRTLLHLHGLGFRLDGQTGIRNPRGMDGEELKVDINGVGADEPAVRNLSLLVERCYLTLSGMYATPYASGLAVVTDEEAEIGVTCLDLGAGTTTLPSSANGSSSIATSSPSVATISATTSPTRFRRRLPKPSESRRFMAIWSVPRPTSTSRSPIR